MFNVPEQYRERNGPLKSDESDKNNGLFQIPFTVDNQVIYFQCIASDGLEWEHVSIVVCDEKRLPKWNEMCFIKDLFWNKSDCILQYHPAESDYVSFHDYCLHLWRPINETFPTPPYYLVGPKRK